MLTTTTTTTLTEREMMRQKKDLEKIAMTLIHHLERSESDEKTIELLDSTGVANHIG